MFGEIKEITWLSRIPLLREMKKHNGDFFVNEHIDFKYPGSVEGFDDLLEYFQRKRAESNENYLGENTKLDRLIVIDNISSLADRSETFADSLTVSQKFPYN